MTWQITYDPNNGDRNWVAKCRRPDGWVLFCYRTEAEARERARKGWTA